MNSRMSPNLWAGTCADIFPTFIYLFPSGIVDDKLMRKCIILMEKLRVSPWGESRRPESVWSDTRELWSHCWSTYFSWSRTPQKKKKKKKSGISDGLFLDCSHLPPFCFLLPLSLYDFAPAHPSLFPALFLSFTLLSTPHQFLKGAGGRLKPGCDTLLLDIAKRLEYKGITILYVCIFPSDSHSVLEGGGIKNWDGWCIIYIYILLKARKRVAHTCAHKLSHLQDAVHNWQYARLCLNIQTGGLMV